MQRPTDGSKQNVFEKLKGKKGEDNRDIEDGTGEDGARSS